MLKNILAISGKPGLFKLVSRGTNMLIVESLIDGKRIPLIQAGFTDFTLQEDEEGKEAVAEKSQEPKAKSQQPKANVKTSKSAAGTVKTGVGTKRG